MTHGALVIAAVIASLIAASSDASAQRRPMAFVSNEASGDVTMIDLTTGKSVGRIAVGSRPRGIHVSPDGSRVYVAISDDQPQQEGSADAIAAISIVDRKVVQRFRAGSDPEVFVVSHDGQRLYS